MIEIQPSPDPRTQFLFSDVMYFNVIFKIILQKDSQGFLLLGTVGNYDGFGLGDLFLRCIQCQLSFLG